MMSDTDTIQSFLRSEIKELDFLYKMDLIEQERKYQYNWDKESRYKLENQFPEILKLQNKRENVNYITVTGRVGSGKSNVSLWLAMYIDTNFRLKNNLYLGKDTDLSLDYIVEEHQKGDYVVIEEAEIMLSRYTSTSLQNRAVKDTLDTVRDFGVNFIFNAPSLNSLDRHFVDWQVNFNIICSFNDRIRKSIDAYVEVNVADVKLDKMGYVEHSKVKFPYISEMIYNQYVKIKRDKLYNPHKYRKSFKQNRRMNIKRSEQMNEADNLILFNDIVSDVRWKKKREALRKQQITVAVQGLELGLSKSKIKGILGIGDNKINQAEGKFLIKLREQSKKEREVS